MLGSEKAGARKLRGLPLGWDEWKKRRDWEIYVEMRERERVKKKWETSAGILSMSLKMSNHFIC